MCKGSHGNSRKLLHVKLKSLWNYKQGILCIDELQSSTGRLHSYGMPAHLYLYAHDYELNFNLSCTVQIMFQTDSVLKLLLVASG